MEEWSIKPVLTFDTADARRNTGRLPRDFAKFSAASVTSRFVALALQQHGACAILG